MPASGSLSLRPACSRTRGALRNRCQARVWTSRRRGRGHRVSGADRRVAFIDDYGGKIELSTQQLRNLITLLVSDQFWTITGL